ncbi:hypothetical protein EGC77_16220 [Shewanella psychromarinicola]|uniref:Uncharacterized protein n=1 Tax=Shewanella psychromarinicola TaxID=2487742 RepID=A0A3N4DSP7_9GAMM|nr:hypothetical protein EGC77_16220 [Shewanella psychromarinicola]
MQTASAHLAVKSENANASDGDLIGRMPECLVAHGCARKACQAHAFFYKKSSTASIFIEPEAMGQITHAVIKSLQRPQDQPLIWLFVNEYDGLVCVPKLVSTKAL